MRTYQITVEGGDPFASRFGLRVFKGTTFSVGFELLDQDGDLVDLTGVTIRFAMKESAESDDFLLRKIIVPADPDSGAFVVTLDPADTAGLPWGHHIWGLYVEFPALSGLGTQELTGGQVVLLEGPGAAQLLP